MEVSGEVAHRTPDSIKVVHLQVDPYSFRKLICTYLIDPFQPQIFGLRGTYSAYLFGHRGQVLVQTLADVHRGKFCRVNNVMDQRYAALGAGQTVQLALKKV